MSTATSSRRLARVCLDARLLVRRLRLRRLRLGPNDIDTPLEVRPVINANACALDIADQAALVADGDLFRHLDIAADAAEDRRLARLDVATYFTVGADGDQAVRFENAFDIAIHQQLFAGANLALDGHGRAYYCRLLWSAHRHGGRRRRGRRAWRRHPDRFPLRGG